MLSPAPPAGRCMWAALPAGRCMWAAPPAGRTRPAECHVAGVPEQRAAGAGKAEAGGLVHGAAGTVTTRQTSNLPRIVAVAAGTPLRAREVPGHRVLPGPARSRRPATRTRSTGTSRTAWPGSLPATHRVPGITRLKYGGPLGPSYGPALRMGRFHHNSGLANSCQHLYGKGHQSIPEASPQHSFRCQRARTPSGSSGPPHLTHHAAGSGGGGGNTVTVTNPGSQTGTVGTTASLQIKASDSTSGQTLTYSASGLPAGLSISSSTGLISGTPTTAGSSSVTVTATDTTGASGSASFTWTISSSTGTGCTAQQLLGNPGFESGSISPWTSTSGVLTNTSSGEPAQAGSWLAWLDGYGAAHTDTVAQQVTIPATCKNAIFSYWAEVNSTVTSTTKQAQNKLVLEVLNSSGTVVQTVPVATAANNGTSYVEYSTNLASYIGQTITLKFIGTEVSGGNTSFLEDSNALNVS